MSKLVNANAYLPRIGQISCWWTHFRTKNARPLAQSPRNLAKLRGNRTVNVGSPAALRYDSKGRIPAENSRTFRQVWLPAHADHAQHRLIDCCVVGGRW